MLACRRRTWGARHDLAGRLAWGLAGLSLVLTIADTVILVQAYGLLSSVALSEKSWPLIDAAAVGASVVGALIVSRLPRAPIGWLLCVVGFIGALALVGESYSVWVVVKDGPGPLARARGRLGRRPGGLADHPDVALGHVPGGSGRAAAVAALVVRGTRGRDRIRLFAAALLLVPPTKFDMLGESRENSVDSGTAGTVLIICFLLLAVATLVAAAVSMVIRFQRAEGERGSSWCFALSACFLAGGVAWLLALRGPIEDPADAWIATLPLALAYFMLPILTGTAVLRYRLYDVDVVVNRAVLLAVGTAFAAAGYVVVVVAVSSVMGTQAGNVWLSLLALAVVALAFQPVRRQLTRLADRLVYGSRAVPYDALSAFSRRLGSTPDPAALLPAVAHAVGRAVSARSATARLQLAGTASIQARWSVAGRGVAPANPAGEHTEVEVADASGHLGTLAVEPHPADSAPARAPAAGGPRRASGAGVPQRPAGSRAPRTSLRWTVRPRRWRRRAGGCSRPRTSDAAGWKPPSPATSCRTSRRCPRN